MTRIQPSYNNTRTTISSTTTTMMLIPWLFLFFISFAHSTTTNAAFVSSASTSTSATVVRDDATLTQQRKQLFFGRRRQTSIRNAYRSSSGPTHLYESRSTSNVDRGGGSATSTSRSGYTQTKFVAAVKARSDTVPFKDGNKNILKDFFLLKAHRDLLFPYEYSVVASGPLNEPFHSRANILQHEYLPPVEGKEVDNALLEFISGGLSFPGIKVTSAIKMSSQTYVSSKTKLPEYRFVLLESSNKAEGPRPIVWLFNKLTGAGESNKEQTTFSCTRVYVEPSSSSNDDGNGTLRFCANAHLEVRLNLPKVMMKLLPMKQDKFEEEGSKSLQGAMKDLQPSIERFQKAYLKWLEL